MRIYGMNWDNNHYLHPDERYMAMVVTGVEWPESFGEYLNPEESQLSPYNRDYGAYIYGTFPLFLTKAVAGVFDMDVYGEVHKVGRTLSAVFDTGSILLVYFIAKEIFSKKTGLISAFFYAITVQVIQQSHFFTVDAFLIFWILLTFKMLLGYLKKEADLAVIWIIFAGISFGFAIASKVSALTFISIVVLVFFKNLLKALDPNLS